MANIKIREPEIDRLKSLARDPRMTRRKASRKLGVHTNTITRHTRRRKIVFVSERNPLPGMHKKTPERLALAKCLGEDPKNNQAEIARRVGVTAQVIRVWRKAHHFEIRGLWRRKEK